ncbi:MAG: hypothetical protein GY753_06915 [Gammaproteobacteria bacterium]|nr:hypothetical protein [Gammaproteobacteria bacterium]
MNNKIKVTNATPEEALQLHDLMPHLFEEPEESTSPVPPWHMDVIGEPEGEGVRTEPAKWRFAGRHGLRYLQVGRGPQLLLSQAELRTLHTHLSSLLD